MANDYKIVTTSPGGFVTVVNLKNISLPSAKRAHEKMVSKSTAGFTVELFLVSPLTAKKGTYHA